MTLEAYTALRNRVQAAEWLDEIGIGRPVKKPSRLRAYALLVFIIAAWNFVVWQAIENLSK